MASYPADDKSFDEKPHQEHLEHAVEPVPADAEDLHLSEQEEKALLRRIDLKVLPLVTVLYLLSFLDRVNIGQANVAGLSKDLKITSIEYQIALVVFFVGYVAIELPFNIILKRWKPPIVIGVSMVAWGIVMTLMCLVRNAAGLQAARFFLGFTEGGLFPGINLLLSCWYNRNEMNLRVAIFFAGATLAGAFGGALAYGISQMQGVAGLEGWRWIFLLEGILTVLVALLAFKYLVNFPEDEKKLLTPLEARKWKHRLATGQGITNVDLGFNWVHINKAFKDWRAWTFMFMYMGVVTPLYSLALFSPVIIRDLGFARSAVSNLLIVPPYTLGFFTCLGVGWLSDRYRMRAPFIIGCMAVCSLGYIILISVKSPGVKYFAVHLAVAGVSPTIACAIAFVASAFGPHITRATALGMFFIGGNSMGIVSSIIYPAKQGPHYIMGHSINLASSGIAMTLATVLMFDNIRKNKKRDAICYANPDGSDFDYRRATEPEEKARWGLQDMSDAEIMGLGQNHPAFRFSL